MAGQRTVGVAVLGIGNIGGAVATAIVRDADALETSSGVRLQLRRRICALRRVC